MRKFGSESMKKGKKMLKLVIMKINFYIGNLSDNFYIGLYFPIDTMSFNN